jgi:hypothetical protein
MDGWDQDFDKNLIFIKNNPSVMCQSFLCASVII